MYSSQVSSPWSKYSSSLPVTFLSTTLSRSSRLRAKCFAQVHLNHPPSSPLSITHTCTPIFVLLEKFLYPPFFSLTRTSIFPSSQQFLASPHLALRRTAVASLRQVIQRRPDAIRLHGSSTERSLLKMLDSEVSVAVSILWEKELVRADKWVKNS